MNSLISNFKNHKFMTIKTYFNIRKLKRLLNKNPIEFDNLDRENIEKVINSNTYNDGGKPLNGFNHTIAAAISSTTYNLWESRNLKYNSYFLIFIEKCIDKFKMK